MSSNHTSPALSTPTARNERRKFVRLNEGSMQVNVKRCGLLDEFGKGEDVEWLNYNQFGIAFVSKNHFNINEKLTLTLKTDTIKAPNLIGVVHNARRQAGKYRYGVQFYFGANAYMKSAEVKELLAALEDTLT